MLLLEPAAFETLDPNLLRWLADFHGCTQDPQDLWKSIQEQAPLVTKPRPQSDSGEAKPESRRVKEVIVTGKRLETSVKQLNSLQDILMRFKDKGPVSEEELDKCLFNAKRDGLLKTKQNPMLVFKFYRKKLLDGGFLLKR
jgi:hypothetical protein